MIYDVAKHIAEGLASLSRDVRIDMLRPDRANLLMTRARMARGFADALEKLSREIAETDAAEAAGRSA